MDVTETFTVVIIGLCAAVLGGAIGGVVSKGGGIKGAASVALSIPSAFAFLYLLEIPPRAGPVIPYLLLALGAVFVVIFGTTFGLTIRHTLGVLAGAVASGGGVSCIIALNIVARHPVPV